MLTPRGFWLFVTLLVTLAAGLFVGSGTIMVVGLAVLAWFLGQWFFFHLRLRGAYRRLSVERRIETPRGPVQSLWSRQRAEVHVTLHQDSPLALPHVLVLDRVPPLAKVKAGTPQADGTLASDEPLEFTYTIECHAPGRLRFEGVKVQLADLQGFFTWSLFVRDRQEIRVLPKVPAKLVHPSLVKRNNSLPLLGTHRHSRPGSGSELLDLRDYIPGDPPKMIAWKASARRDKLMTKEFESEVPVRCTLFIDASQGTRIGPVGRTALGRLVEIAAGVAQANSAERDLTGLCLFDEEAVRVTQRPGRGSTHAARMLDALTEAASLMPIARGVPIGDLVTFAYGLAQDLYPDWLLDDVNHFPIWLPMWSPQPNWSIPKPPLLVRGWWDWPRVLVTRWFRNSFLALGQWRRSRLSPLYHRQYRWRKQLAAILSVLHELGPRGLTWLLEDDEACSHHLQRFLADHQAPYPQPLYDAQGNYLFGSSGKISVLADALVAAIARGKDNELFVLCVDLLEVGPDLAPLERAVCAALARHHQAMVICPWPPSVPLPGEEPKELPAVTDLHEWLLQGATTRMHAAFALVQRAFGRFGVPVVCAAADDTVDIVLNRMQRMKLAPRNWR
jgi:uncharacterized protein (DUF58 family)